MDETKQLKKRDAYLDIETTGLSCQDVEITVIGICLINSVDSEPGRLGIPRQLQGINKV